MSVIVDRCGEAIDIAHVKRRNPYALQFSIPDRCLEVSMLVGVRISKNGCPLGVRQVKCESRLRELDQILRAHDNPLEFMCQVIIRISDNSIYWEFFIICYFIRRHLASILVTGNNWIIGWSTRFNETFHRILTSYPRPVEWSLLKKSTRVSPLVLVWIVLLNWEKYTYSLDLNLFKLLIFLFYASWIK